MNFQGIVVEHDIERSLLTLNVHRNGIVDDTTFIAKIIVFAELVGTVNPKYVLFDKSETNFEISPRLFKFAARNVIGEIMDHGVRLIFFLVGVERYRLYMNDTQRPVFIMPCESMTQVMESISADRMLIPGC